MALIPKFIGIIKDGKIILANKLQFQDYLLSLEGQEVELGVDKIRWDRSSNQNRYYWGVIVKMIAEETGHTNDEIHQWLKVEFNGELVIIGNKEIKIGKSTAGLDIEKFEDYCQKIRIWALEILNITIPLPNEIILEEE